MVCLCADWCSACKAYRNVFSQVSNALAHTHSDCRLIWLDVEDQADLVGDLDIETFPTLLAGNERGLSFFGAVTPQADVLRRLIDSLLEPGAEQVVHLPETRRIIEQLEGLPQLRPLQADESTG